MERFWNFIGYCFKSMFGAFAATVGHAPKDYTYKNMMIGIITFMVILGIVSLSKKNMK